MENSPPKGYLQDHTVISATHSRIFTESKGITPNSLWQDQDQNLTRPKQKSNNATGCENNQESMGCQSNGNLCDSDALQWLKTFQRYCSSSPKHLGAHPVFLSTPDRQLWKDNWQTHNGLSFFSWVFPFTPFGKAVMYGAVSEAASWAGESDHPRCQPSSFLNANHIGLSSTIIKTCWPSFLQNKILCLPSSCAKPKSHLKINPLTSKETLITILNAHTASHTMKIAWKQQLLHPHSSAKMEGYYRMKVRPREGQRP